ncbi:hypothetical protein [Terriglobus saanensis]|nr:hypothetical protein [Terriglobus saanensis]
MFLLALLPVNPALAQSSALSLEEALQHLESNSRLYQATAPDFFCNEHVVSTKSSLNVRERTVTDSIFRVERRISGHNKRLIESREVKAVNGHPSTRSELPGPITLQGVFSGGLDVVSTGQTSCMRYAFDPGSSDPSTNHYAIQFATLPEEQRRPGCSLSEDTNGRILVDKGTMQVEQMDLVTPHHVFLSGLEGIWRISITYGTVDLDNHRFRMPKTIVSTLTWSDIGGVTVWSFDATYSNYHKFGVSAYILPVQ